MVSKLLTFISGRLNHRIYARPQSMKQPSNQARRSEFYKYTRLPVTRWVKLSQNFESQSRF